MTAALIKRILYLLATVTTVAFVYQLAYLPQGIWLFASAFLFLNFTLETTLLRRTIEIAAAGLLAILFIFIGTLLAPYLAAQIGCFALITGFCVYMGAWQGKSTYPWFVINFLAVLSLQSSASMAAAFAHVAAVAASIMIVITAQLILLPFFSRDEYRRSRKIVLHRLSRLSTTIFNCLIAPDYPDNIYLYERRVHKQKIKCLNRMARFAEREAVAAPSAHAAQELQTLFEMMLDLGQIRRRVTDHTIFALCADELTGLSTAINFLFDALAACREQQIEQGLLMLEKYLNQFESSFEHILRVTAREPLVFVLMMGTLKALLPACRQAAGMDVRHAEVAA